MSVRAPHRPHRCRGLARGGTIRIALGLSGCGDEGAPGTAAASVNSSGDRPTESDGIVAAYQEVDRLFQVVREGKSRADAAAAFGERVTK